MTIIASFQSDVAAVLVGDLLVSTSGSYGRPATLPLRFAPEQTEIPGFVAGLLQKLVLVRPYLAVAWAGQEIVARGILKLLHERADDRMTPESILALIQYSGFSEAELKEVGFIFYLLDSAGGRINLQIQDYLTGQTEVNELLKVKYCGSGQYHFLETISFNLRRHAGDVNQFETFVSSVLSRIAIAMFEEVISDDPYSFRYGGGFEYILPNPHSRALEKQPVAFAFWTRSDSSISLRGPILCQNYDDQGFLHLDRLCFKEGSGWQRSTYIVGNPLLSALGARPVSFPIPNYDPFMVVHYLIGTSPDSSMLLVIKKGVQKNCKITVDPNTGSVDLNIGAGFPEEIAALLNCRLNDLQIQVPKQ